MKGDHGETRCDCCFKEVTHLFQGPEGEEFCSTECRRDFMLYALNQSLVGVVRFLGDIADGMTL